MSKYKKELKENEIMKSLILSEEDYEILSKCIAIGVFLLC